MFVCSVFESCDRDQVKSKSKQPSLSWLWFGCYGNNVCELVIVYCEDGVDFLSLSTMFAI